MTLSSLDAPKGHKIQKLLTGKSKLLNQSGLIMARLTLKLQLGIFVFQNVILFSDTIQI